MNRPRRVRESPERVLLLVQTTVPSTLRAFFKDQLKWLRNRGMEVHAVAAPGGALGEVGQREGVIVHGIPMTRRISVFADLLSLWRAIRLLRTVRPTIVHGFTPKGGLIAMLAAWLTRTSVRAYTVFGFAHMAKTGPLRSLLSLTERISCKLAHRVFCECASIRDVAVAERICPSWKIRVLSAWKNSIDEGFGRTADAVSRGLAVRRALGIPESAPVVAFVGRIVRDKGISELIEAYRILAPEFPALHVILVGEFEPGNAIDPRTLSRLSSDAHIHAVGFERDIVPYLATTDVLAHPSYREGFPSVPIEAAALEVPVVATRIPGNVDAVRDGVTGTLVPPRDAKALAGALRMYLSDPALRRQHGRAGRERVLRDFRREPTWEALLQEYIHLLQKNGVGVFGTAL